MNYKPKFEGEFFQSLATVWDITKAWGIADKATEMSCPVKPFYDRLLSRLDTGRIDLFGMDLSEGKEYALSDKCDTAVPLLFVMVKLDDGKEHAQIIDGCHRLYKAFHTGLEEMPALVFDPDTGLKFTKSLL